jgi:GNAT superfamily N-acetyltransferase
MITLSTETAPTERASTMTTIRHAGTDDEIAATWEVMRQLRPHLLREDYVAVIRDLMECEGYRLAVLRDEGEVRAVAGYRLMTMLYCGRLLYVDDFVTDERARSRGYGSELLEWLKAEGRARGCAELQLISRVARERAHRFYFREGLGIECFHFRAAL